MYLVYYYLFINIISLFLYSLDKYLAIKRKRRISEKTLLISTILGGFIGTTIGMYVFHHKTKKWYFKLNIVLSIIIHLLLFYLYMVQLAHISFFNLINLPII